MARPAAASTPHRSSGVRPPSFVILSEQDGADAPDHGRRGRQEPDDVRAALDLIVEQLQRVRAVQLPLMLHDNSAGVSAKSRSVEANSSSKNVGLVRVLPCLKSPYALTNGFRSCSPSG